MVEQSKMDDCLNILKLVLKFYLQAMHPNNVPWSMPKETKTLVKLVLNLKEAKVRPITPATPVTPGRRNFRLRIEGELFFRRGAINMIIGPTGAGKTSILMALLGEMVSDINDT